MILETYSSKTTGATSSQVFTELAPIFVLMMVWSNSLSTFHGQSELTSNLLTKKIQNYVFLRWPKNGIYSGLIVKMAQRPH